MHSDPIVTSAWAALIHVLGSPVCDPVCLALPQHMDGLFTQQAAKLRATVAAFVWPFKVVSCAESMRVWQSVVAPGCTWPRLMWACSWQQRVRGTWAH